MRATRVTRRRRRDRGIEHRHRGLGGGGNLRAAVFGVNDGLVSNASLILGIAGANPDPHVVLLAGVAGMAAGAFAMAAGEYVSVRSQRELFEYQIGLERDELEEYPEAEAQELALIYAAKGVPPKEARQLADKLVADPEHALDTLAREELGLNPEELGSPWGAVDLVVPVVRARCAAAARCPSCWRPGRLRSSVRHRRHRGRAVRRRRAAVALHRAQRVAIRAAHAACWAGSPAPSPTRSAAWQASPLVEVSRHAAAQARPRQVAARAASVDVLGRDRDASTGTPASGDTVDILPRRRRVRRPRAPTRRRRRSARGSGPSIRAKRSTLAFFARRVARAVAARAPMLDARHTGCRLIHGESDGLPGVVADRYGDTVVLQLSAAGAERWRDAIVDALATATGARVRLRALRRRRAQPRRTRRRASASRMARCRPRCMLVEDGLAYRVDVVAGQKTGFFLDQRDSRAAVRAMAAGRETLNVFCYTGGFTLAALAGGATRVLSIDSSADALALGRENLARNPALDASRAEWQEADAFAALRTLRDKAASFDLIVLDPPKFAPTMAHAERAARAYKDINLLALKLLRPRRPPRHVLLLGRRGRRAVSQDRRRRGAGCRRPTPRSSGASARLPITRSRSRFPRANT